MTPGMESARRILLPVLVLTLFAIALPIRSAIVGTRSTTVECLTLAAHPPRGAAPDSRASYERCLVLEPDDVELMADLGGQLEASGDPVRAEALYRRALTIEDGAWGHGVLLFPQVVRIPLIIHVPERLKSRVTADLTQVAFSSDIAPTLYQLTGHPPRDLGPLFGRPIIVPSDTPLTDDRRRDSFIIVSSYAPTYAVLRHNGRLLYIADLVNGREYIYDLTSAPLGTRMQVTDAERRVNRGLIRAQVTELAALYHFTPQP